MATSHSDLCEAARAVLSEALAAADPNKGKVALALEILRLPVVTAPAPRRSRSPALSDNVRKKPKKGKKR